MLYIKQIQELNRAHVDHGHPGAPEHHAHYAQQSAPINLRALPQQSDFMTSHRLFNQTSARSSSRDTSSLLSSAFTTSLIFMGCVSVLSMGCTLSFDEFEPYTTEEGYIKPIEVQPDVGVMPDMVVNPEIDMEVPIDMAPIPDPDRDMDGVNDEDDNCPDDPNPDQLDGDMDGVGDACDDDDMDGVLDYQANEQGESVVYDNCIDVPNADQRDLDWDGIGDACDPDLDGDGLDVTQENARGTDPNLADSDRDGIIDALDTCPTVPSRGLDSDDDGLGDACDLDDDNDLILDWIDACPFHADPEQAATPEEAAAGRGSACALDFDADGLEDALDPCPHVPVSDSGIHPTCEAPQILAGFDDNVYDLMYTGGYVWAASAGSVSRFNLIDDVLEGEERFTTRAGLWSNRAERVSALKVVGPNLLEITGTWVAQGARLAALRYDGALSKYWGVEIDLSDSGVTRIYDIAGIDQGAVIATDNGLYLIAYDKVTELPVEPLMNPQVSALYTSGSTILFSIDGSLYRTEIGEMTTVELLATFEGVNQITGIKPGGPGAPHDSSAGAGLERVTLLTDADVIFYDLIANVETAPRLMVGALDALARDTGLYLATDAGLIWSSIGVELSAPMLNAVGGRKVRALAQANDTLLIGGASEGDGSASPDALGDEVGIRVAGGVWTRRPFDGENCPVKLISAPNGAQWVATNNGLYHRDPAGVQTLVIESPIYDIYASADTLWVATQSQVYRVDIDLIAGDMPQITDYSLPSFTPPITGVYQAGDVLWASAQEGVAYAPLVGGVPQAWTELNSAEFAGLPSGEVVSFGYDGTIVWIAVRGPDGGIARYSNGSFNPVVYSQINAIIPSNQITDMSVNAERVVITTEGGVSIFKPVIAAANDIDDLLYNGQGIPNQAETSHVLSVVDIGSKLWMISAPTTSNPYGGLFSIDVDGERAPLRTIGSERFYSARDVDMLKSTLPNVFRDRSHARLGRVARERGYGLTLATCGDVTSPGVIATLDSDRGITDVLDARGLPGSGRGVLLPSPRGHAMFSTVMGELRVDEDQGPGETRFVDLYAPLEPEEEWTEGLEPARLYANNDELPYPIQLCRSFEQQNEETKRLVCILEGNYLARQIRNAWSIEEIPLLNDPTLKVRALVLKPDNPSNEQWVATDRGLLNIRNGQERIVSVMNTDGGLPSDDISALVLDELQQTLYVGTARGVVSFNIALNLPEDLTLIDWTVVAPSSRLLRGRVSALAWDGPSTLWVGVESGAARWSAGELTVYALGASLPGAPVTSIAVAGTYVALAHSSGLSIYDGATWTHYGSRAGAYNVRGELIVDDRGVIWALTESGALGFTSAMSSMMGDVTP